MSVAPAREHEREREEARRLLELVPDTELATVLRVLAWAAGTAKPEGSSQGAPEEMAESEPCPWETVLAAFDNAPEDDEELTPEDIEALAEADKAIAEGRVYTDAEVRRRLGL